MPLVEQRLRLFEIGRFEPFREPAIDGAQQIARFAAAALIASQTGKVRGSAIPTA
jgi:hypothetical protein